MFVNFSNHPSRFWDNKQIEASREYGELVDMPFPRIVPNATDKDLHELTQQYVQRITSLGPPKEITVHIMGEMTFTYMVVTKLKELGIRCVASTTERKTSYSEDGTKFSEFSFVRFREY